ncbi:MAG: hypothetical protein ACYTG0_23970 [Planctomycetota bacterium]|jgi:hypothetical protein
MGVTSFTERLESHFLNQLDPTDIPKEIDPRDWETVREWFKEAFGYWFLEHRDALIGREWVKRGWAESVLQPDPAGKLKESFRVKPECIDTIDAWLQDEID